ncbi:MAG TPA: hypothetical protein VMH22_01040 [bacterium]|nr:hypothetical protein [bacterium]
MKRTAASASVRRVDKALTIVDLFDGKGFNFDCVIANLEGDHPSVTNAKSDRIYFILEGHGKVRVADETYDVGKYDLVAIGKGTVHSVSGSLKYLIVTAPPFDPANERLA